jgi:hypothetical protein
MLVEKEHIFDKHETALSFELVIFKFVALPLQKRNKPLTAWLTVAKNPFKRRAAMN